MSQNPDDFSNEKKKAAKKRLSNSSEVLHGLFENGKTALSEQFLRWKLWKRWPEFVGPSIGQATEPVGYSKGILYVWVSSSAWMQQMLFVLDPMRDKINTQLGFNYVKSIHLTMDRRSVPKDALAQEELKESIGKLVPESQDLE